MFGPCKTCIAKGSHISALEAEIASLRKLVFPPSRGLPVVNLEANKILDASDEVTTIMVEPSQDELREQRDANSEAIRLLSGNY